MREPDTMLDLLIEALPYVEEGEHFNKPTQRGLSKRIRAMIEESRNSRVGTTCDSHFCDD